MSDNINCPKCGRAVEAGAFICPGCEYILDTSFLGEDITDDERDKRKRTTPGGLKRTLENPAQANAPMNSVNFGEDAIILGNGQGEYSDFETKDAGMTREVTHARFYIGGNTAAILHIDAVPEIAPGILEGSLKMSPFERHVLGFINGKRSIGRIQKKSAMEDSEFKTSVAMLADKGIIRLRTTKKRKNKDGTSGLPSRSEGMRAAPGASSSGSASGTSDRTVVASFEQLSEEHARQLSASHSSSSSRPSSMNSMVAAAAALEDAMPARAQVLGSRTNPGEATIIKSSSDPSRKKSTGGPGFASVRLQENAAPTPILADDAMADEWGADDNANNISNVFARAPSPAKKRGPALADLPPVVSDAIDGDDEVARPPPLPQDTGDFPLVTGDVTRDLPRNPPARSARDMVDDADIQVDGVMPDPEEFVPPGGEDDFFRGRSKETAALGPAAADNVTTGPQTGPPASVKARTTSPGGAPVEPPALPDDDDGVPASLRDPTGIGNLVPVDLRGGAALPPDEGDDDRGDEAAGFDDGDDVAGFADEPDPEAPDQAPDPEATAAAASLPPPRPGRPGRVDADDSDVETFIQMKRRDGDEDGIPPTAARMSSRTADEPAASYTDDVPTGPLPPDDDDEIDAEDDDASFDVDLRTAHLERINSANTASLPARESIPNLPSDALQPLPSTQGAAVQPPPIPQAIPAVPASPAPSSPAPSPSAFAASFMASSSTAAAPPALPGQRGVPPPGLPGQRATAPVAGVAVPGLPGAPSGGPSRPPTIKGGLPVQRTSAGSKVPFEQARKAEKIFEQAMKDHAEGRISSARMNAKLAAMYDPSIETYSQFLADLDAQGANAPSPGARKPRELTLFEQASEAEGRGDFEKAIDCLEEAVSINPKAAALRNRLGVVMSIRLKRHTEALEQLRIAIELEPGNIVYMNNFSKVTALLDSQLEKGPEDKKKKGRFNPDEKVQIKKMRPKMF